MKKYIYTVGTVALSLAMSGLPALALAENTDGEVSVQTQVRVQTKGIEASTTAGVGASVTAQELQKRQEMLREAEQKQNLEASSSNEQAKQQLERTGSTTEASSTRPAIKGGENTNENVQDDFNLELEDGGALATSNDDLNQKIEVRKNQLAQEVASTSPDHQEIVANANPVRLAVHALLASKDLIGGIGQQVSDIAQQMNDSVASTTKAEAKIQSRGFLTRLLFGGDTTSAEVIAQEAAKNQARIDSLTALLAGSNISADVQVTLKAQITALQTAQARLQDLAQKEKSAWGLFSWRF